MKVHQKIVDNQLARVGTVHCTNSGGELVITKYINSYEVHVRFIETGFETVARMSNIRNGKVKDLLQPSIFGVGVVGEEVLYDEGATKEYTLWKEMLRRCYDENFKVKNTTYENCVVSENFKLLSYFKDWCSKQVGFGNEDWHLDKDILSRECKVYSEDTCCFVPRSINQAVVTNKTSRGEFLIGVHQSHRKGRFKSCVNINGKRKILGNFDTQEEAFYVYKEAKEAYIKELANKWKDQIDPRVYEALMKYKIEITD